MNDDQQWAKAQLNTINRLGIKSHLTQSLSNDLGIVPRETSKKTKKKTLTTRGKRKD